MYFFQQGRYELIFRHALQHLAVGKDDAHSLAAGDAEIGSRASPGPLTTQPMTATLIGTVIPDKASCTSWAKPIKSTWVRPQVGKKSASARRS